MIKDKIVPEAIWDAADGGGYGVIIKSGIKPNGEITGVKF